MGIFTQLAQASSSYSDPSTLNNTEAAVTASFVAFFAVFVLFVVVVSYVLYAFLLGRIFKKAGVEQWIAWVPFYNNWKLLELGGQQGFWSVLSVFPVLNIVSAIFLYIAMYNVGLKLQKEGWFVVLAIFLTIVWLAWLAFDGSVWNEKGGAAPAVK